MEFNHEATESNEVATNEPVSSEPLSPNASATKWRRQPGFRQGSLAAIAALVVVLVIGTAGFTLGHYVFTPGSVRLVPSYSRTNLPNGFGNFPSFNVPPSGGSGSVKVSPAAAKIATAVDPGLVDIDTGISYQGASAAGTGIVISSKGLVLTNNHVIEGSTSITARDVATGTTYKAKVLGYDVSKDIALLQLENASGLTTVSLGDSSSVKVNDKVVGIGNAGGVGGTPSFAAGTIVATNQSLNANNADNPSGSESLSGMIETNAGIQAGDSGGPLVNSKGKVIGIDTAASASSGEFGFGPQGATANQAYAVPINTAVAIATSIENGVSTASIHLGKTAYLGLEIAPTLSGFAANPNGSTAPTGVAVAGLVANGPAANAGLATGDVVNSFNGHAVTSAAALETLEFALKPGDSATVGYLTPSGEQKSVTLKLGSGPPQ